MAYGYTTSGIRLRIRPPNRIDLFLGASKTPHRTLHIPQPFLSAACCDTRRGSRTFPGIWVKLADNRTLVYAASNGRLLEEIPDPLKDRRLQSALAKLRKRIDCKIRYTVIFPVSQRSNGFYNFSRGTWEWNHIPEGVMFKNRKLAVAAAKILTNERRAPDGAIASPNSRALQVVGYQIGQRKLLNIVRTRFTSYVPTLPRTCQGSP